VAQFCRALTRNFPQRICRRRGKPRGLKVLVIGDTIFDRYSSVSVAGFDLQEPDHFRRFLKEEYPMRGALAVFRHVKQFTPQVKFLSLVGTRVGEPICRNIWARTRTWLPCADQEFTTIIKQPVCGTPDEGKELVKLFAVNYIDRDPPPLRIQKKVTALIQAEIAKRIW